MPKCVDLNPYGRNPSRIAHGLLWDSVVTSEYILEKNSIYRDNLKRLYDYLCYVEENNHNIRTEIRQIPAYETYGEIIITLFYIENSRNKYAIQRSISSIELEYEDTIEGIILAVDNSNRLLMLEVSKGE